MTQSDPIQTPAESDRLARAGYTSKAEEAELERRSRDNVLKIVRLLFMIMLATVALLPFVGSLTGESGGNLTFTFGTVVIAFAAICGFGVLVILLDTVTPVKRLSTVFGVYLGVAAGLAGAVGIATLVDLIAESWSLTGGPLEAYVGLTKVAIGIALCYLAVSIVLTTKDDFRLVIPYVEFAKQIRGVKPLLVDTSTLIDARIDALVQAGFVDAPIVVPRFVIDELQILSDSEDKLKRARGRRGLDLVSKLQSNPNINVSIEEVELAIRGGVDRMLVELARSEQMRILTTDYNLGKVARIQGVTALNINDLANGLKPAVIPGDTMAIEIVKAGENEGQGVGYLPDGTMVVVEEASRRMGEHVQIVVTNSLQTSAGRMIFGKVESASDKKEREGAVEDHERIERAARSATTQPRSPAPSRREPPSGRRNPRR